MHTSSIEVSFNRNSREGARAAHFISADTTSARGPDYVIKRGMRTKLTIDDAIGAKRVELDSL